MVLITCSDCGRGVSSLAPTCPHCGRPANAESTDSQPRERFSQAPRKRSSPRRIVTFVVCALIIVEIALMSGTKTKTASTETEAWTPAKAKPDSVPYLDALNHHIADSILASLRASDLRSLSDARLEYLSLYGTSNVGTVRREQANRKERADGRAKVPLKTAPGTDDPSSYQSLLANVWPGKPLYSVTDHAYIGNIVDVEDDHLFDDGTTRDGVLVQFANGTSGWVPRKTLQQIYVTR
jgi:hypothetical protein